ncbi:MAG: S8 family serine peptidase [Candidatus Peribacteria bacterium]|nr:MAG: S8 family serine peptidase [Candidatus Peribacteria bacterium]
MGWSNYGACVDLYTYGEHVITASVQSSSDNRYLVADGTSFSAPIVAGVIALGYNIYGRKSYGDVYDAIIKSTQ